jgi:hypothetical protein
MPPGCVCTGPRYGAVEGDDFDVGCTVEGAGDVNIVKTKEWPSAGRSQPLVFMDGRLFGSL